MGISERIWRIGPVFALVGAMLAASALTPASALACPKKGAKAAHAKKKSSAKRSKRVNVAARAYATPGDPFVQELMPAEKRVTQERSEQVVRDQQIEAESALPAHEQPTEAAPVTESGQVLPMEWNPQNSI